MLTPEPKVYKEWTELLKITFKSSWGIAYKWVSITPLDIWSFIWLSDEDIVQKIKSELKIDINQEKSLWLKKLNYLFYKWVEYYKDEYGREKFWKNYAIDYLKQDFFSSKEDVIEFCRETEKQTAKWKINCAISKCISIVNDILENKSLDKKWAKSLYVLNNYLVWPFSLKEMSSSWWFITYDWYYILKKWVKRKKINFTLTWRSKSGLSCKRKSASDPKYHRSELIQDMIWWNFYCENKKDLLILMNAVWQLVYNVNINEESLMVKNKWVFSRSEIKDINDSDFVSDNFKEIIINWIQSSPNKKNSSAEEYQDIKMIWSINIPKSKDLWVEWAVTYPTWFEIKFVLAWSKNDDWLSFQPIMDYQKWFYWKTRIQNPIITEKEIVTQVDKLLYSLEEEIWNKNLLLKENEQKSVLWYIEELYNDLLKKWFIKDRKWFNFKKGKMFWINTSTFNTIRDWLILYFKSSLIQVSKLEYTTKRAFELSELWFNPPMKKTT